MFRSKGSNKHEKITEKGHRIVHASTITGRRASTLSRFEFNVLGIPQLEDYPYQRPPGTNIVCQNKDECSYTTILYLPFDCFKINLFFKSSDEKAEELQFKASFETLHKKIISRSKTKGFSYIRGHISCVNKEILNFNYLIGNQSLSEFLADYRDQIPQVAEFLSLYDAAPKTCERNIYKDNTERLLGTYEEADTMRISNCPKGMK